MGLNDKLQKKAFEEEYETARLYGQDSRHIWVCFRDPEDEQEDGKDVIHVSYIAAFQNQPTIVYSGTDEVSRDYLLNIVGESDISKEPVFWPKDRNALAQIVTYIEWLARIAIYPEQTYMLVHYTIVFSSLAQSYVSTNKDNYVMLTMTRCLNYHIKTK